MPDQQPISTQTRILLVAAIVVPLAILLGPVLFGGRSFVFRDAAHFYYPLYQAIAERWATGQIPLWNPQENTGMPMAADPPLALFYPGKLLFMAPWSYALSTKLYTAFHLLLAAWGARRHARRLGADEIGATLGALCYVASGAVLIQACNIIFLVGAAWLPWALAAAHDMLTTRRFRSAINLAIILALMTLGGDPQMTYHAGILATLYAWGLWRWERRHALAQPATTQGPHRLLLLASAATIAFALAAVQIFPAMEWSGHSDRATFESPRSLYEVPNFLSRGETEESLTAGLLGQTDPGTHHRLVYHFSVGPWRWAEFIWPNVYGRQFPENRRWISALPAEGRVWTPSLYLGVLPLLLAFVCLWTTTKSSQRQWIGRITLFGLLAALGWYGVGWVVLETMGTLGAKPPKGLASPIGGVYWLLTNTLPGYVYFRYPGKWLVPASLGISQLAAIGLTTFGDRGRLFLQRACAGVVGVSVVLMIVAAGMASRWETMLAGTHNDLLFGPLDTAGAWNDMMLGLFHAVMVCGFVFAMLRFGKGRLSTHSLKLTILVVTALELVAANWWMLPTAPDRLWTDRPAMVDTITADASTPANRRSFRGAPSFFLPRDWQHSTSPTRQHDGATWDRATLMPRYHLTYPIDLLESTGSASPRDHVAMMSVARGHGVMRPQNIHEPHPGVLDVLGAEFLILPDDVTWPQGDVLDFGKNDIANVQVVANQAAFPRAWVVHDVTTLPPLITSSAKDLRRRTTSVFFPGGRLRNFRHEAIVETEATFPRQDAGNFDEEEKCEIISYEPERIELNVQLTRPGLVVLSDTFCPGWIAETTNATDKAPHRVPIYRTNRVMRGIWLPAGTHRLTMQYSPWSVRIGVWVSLLSWGGVIGMLIWVRRKLCSTGSG